MENQNGLKWYQKPEGVFVLLILLFPVGLYQMWKNELWTKKQRWIITGVILVSVFLYNRDNSGGLSNDASSSENKSKSYSCVQNDFTSAIVFSFEKNTEDGHTGSIYLTIKPEYYSSFVGFKGKYIEGKEDSYDGMITISHVSPESDGNWERIAFDVRDNAILYRKDGKFLILTNKTANNPILSYLDNSKFILED